MSLGKFLQHLWDAIKKIFDGIEAHTRQLLPIAIQIVQNIKTLEDSKVPDILTAIIPGNLDNDLNQKIRDFLPKLLLDLQLAESVSSITDPNEQLKAILDKINLSGDNTKNILYHGIASLIVEKLSDGKFTWSDAIAVSEYYYKNVYKQSLQPAPATGDQPASDTSTGN